MKKLYIIFAVLLLVYMIWPGPSKISDFNPLPNSIKSKFAGDNPPQVPNVAGYFSNYYRDFVVSYYYKNYWSDTKLPIPPLRLNYPPEYSFVAIKKHTDTTFLEEFVYPLRDSIYVNGFEPSKLPDGQKFYVDGQFLDNKTTIRFYPSGIMVKVMVWFGIILSILFVYKLGREIIFKK